MAKLGVECYIAAWESTTMAEPTQNDQDSQSKKPTDSKRPQSDSTRAKSDELRAAQRQEGQRRVEAGAKNSKANPIVEDETYGELNEDNRVVMRHAIALNIDSFKASTEGFEARPQREYPPLQATAAPFLSVIVPNYNGRALLQSVLGALSYQTFTDFEVILIDDASTDESVAFVEQFFSASAFPDPVQAPSWQELRVIVNRQNRGFAASCNAAADVARGQVLVMLNTDTEPEWEWLEELAKSVCANPQAAMVASKMLLFDERAQLHTAGDLLGVDGIPRNRGVWEEDRGQYDSHTTIFSGSGGATAYRKDVWQMLGGFDEDFWMYLEDVDYGFRAQLAGWEAVFAPKARLYHRLSATSGHTMASYYVGRNTIWNIAKNMPRALLLRNFPAIVAGQFKVALDALRNIRGEAARARLNGQLAGLLGLSHALQKRSVIQPRRVIEDNDLQARLSMTSRH